MKDMIVKLWKKWFGKIETESVLNNSVETPVVVEKKKVKKSLLATLESYLFAHYDFRFNLLTEQPEYVLKGQKQYQMVDQRVLNTLCIDARNEGINCWDKDVSRLLLSQKVPDFHPFQDYMSKLPEWDGTDRVSELAKRILDKALWVNGFHRWMLGMAAQWMNLEGQCANAVAPLLVSTEVLVSLGVERIRTKYGSSYRVVPLVLGA